MPGRVQSLRVHILSGDQKMRKAFVAAAPGFNPPGAGAATNRAEGKHLRMHWADLRAPRFVSRRRDLRGPPPAGGEALYRWCRQTVIIGHGWPTPTPDRPHQISMNAWHAVGMIDACVQSHGEIR